MHEEDGKYYIEFFKVGNVVKVTAIDPVSLEEVCIVAPENASRDEMTRIVVQKLERRISKLLEERQANQQNNRKNTKTRAQSAVPSGRGILA